MFHVNILLSQNSGYANYKIGRHPQGLQRIILKSYLKRFIVNCSHRVSIIGNSSH